MGPTCELRVSKGRLDEWLEGRLEAWAKVGRLRVGLLAGHGGFAG